MAYDDDDDDDDRRREDGLGSVATDYATHALFGQRLQVVNLASRQRWLVRLFQRGPIAPPHYTRKPYVLLLRGYPTITPGFRWRELLVAGQRWVSVYRLNFIF